MSNQASNSTVKVRKSRWDRIIDNLEEKKKAFGEKQSSGSVLVEIHFKEGRVSCSSVSTKDVIF